MQSSKHKEIGFLHNLSATIAFKKSYFFIKAMKLECSTKAIMH